MKDSIKEVKLQSLSFLIPSRKYGIDFDITKKLPIPALIECSIRIISEIHEILPKQLQEFFGLNNVEREILIDQLLNTGWITFNSVGNLEASQKLLDWSSSGSNELVLTEIFSCSEEFVVDLLTSHIQPRSSNAPAKGLPRILDDQITKNSIDAENIFVNQFIRFKDCINNAHVKDYRSNLYRVCNVKHLNVTEIILSVDLVLKVDDLFGAIIEPKMTSYNENNTKLISSSGLFSILIQHLSKIQPPQTVKMSFENYCEITKDPELLKHYNNESNFFDMETLLKNGSSEIDRKTHRIIGPIYENINKNNVVINYLKKLKDVEKLPFAIWKPANVKLFGASALLKEFVIEANSLLNSYGSEVITLFPDVSDADNYQIKETYKNNRIGSAYFIDTSRDLNECEIFVLPGLNGFAFCQYHVTLDPKLKFPGLTVPVGYFTTDVERVKMLWIHLKQFYTVIRNFELKQFSSSNYQQNKMIENTDQIKMIVEQLMSPTTVKS